MNSTVDWFRKRLFWSIIVSILAGIIVSSGVVMAASTQPGVCDTHDEVKVCVFAE